MPAHKITKRLLSVEHITIQSKRSFKEVRDAFERLVPVLDPGIIDRLQAGDHEAIAGYEKKGPTLFRFLERNHGALLAIVDDARDAVQYEIGNPIIATKMTRHKLGASLYAPLRITLLQSNDGFAAFEYDLPSSFFGQFGDERVTDVGHYLDRELEAVLLKVTA